jgi:hypothetical protein
MRITFLIGLTEVFMLLERKGLSVEDDRNALRPLSYGYGSLINRATLLLNGIQQLIE